jgi:hypothetical protein
MNICEWALEMGNDGHLKWDVDFLSTCKMGGI